MSFRPKELHGWKLFNHVKAMAAHPHAYTPPLWFNAMSKVPPNFNGREIAPKKGNIVFPDDALRKRIEKRSKVAKILTKQGYAPVPWFFARRPFDEAVIEIKKMIRDMPDKSEEQVIDAWDAKMRRHLAVREREMQLQRDDALRRARSGNAAGSGQGTDSMEHHEQVITAGDSVKILHMLRDAQVESSMRLEQRLQESLRKASQLDAESAQDEYGHLDATPKFSLMTGRLKQNGTSDRVMKVFLDSIAIDENGEPVAVKRQAKKQEASTVAQVEETTETKDPVTEYLEDNRMIDFEREVKLRRFELEKRLNPTVLRKMAAAKEIDKLMKVIVELRHEYGPIQVNYSTEFENNPFEFLLTFCKAYKVNAPHATSMDYTRERTVYPQTVVGSSMKVQQVLSDAYEEFFEAFQHYCRLDEAQLDPGRVLRNLDLGFADAAAEEGLDGDALSANPFAASRSEQDREAYMSSSHIIPADAPINPVLSQNNPVLMETGITAPDFTPLVQSLARHNYSNYELIKTYQPKMEELFYLLEIEQFLSGGVLRKYAAEYVEPEWAGPKDQYFTAITESKRAFIPISMDEIFQVMVNWEYSEGTRADRQEEIRRLQERIGEEEGEQVANESDLIYGKLHDFAEEAAPLASRESSEEGEDFDDEKLE